MNLTKKKDKLKIDPWLMKAIFLSLLLCSLFMASCAVFRAQTSYPPFTARGCHLDSIRVQSAGIFNEMIRKSRDPRVFITSVYERDSVIRVEWIPENDTRAGGAIIVNISKKNCNVMDMVVFQ